MQAAPYLVNRADAWQARINEAARNYFTPAEMSDLQRIGIRFVPQEAELIKRHLRRKGDYAPDKKSRTHPRYSEDNQLKADRDVQNRGNLAPPPNAQAALRSGARAYIGPDTDAAGEVTNQANMRPMRLDMDNEGVVNPEPVGDSAKVVTPNKDSLLRRTQLFIGSIFVFDLAHALLRHLRQEALSLTANGTEADDDILKQLCRNVRGMTFVKLVPVADGTPKAISIKDPSTQAVKSWAPEKVTTFDKYEDIFKPFSISDLQLLRNKGYIAKDGNFYAPHRIPQWLGSTIRSNATSWTGWGLFSSNDLYATPARVRFLRNQGIYPTTFLTNGMLADDTCAARLIEHINSGTIYTEFFSWELRKLVFVPLELDVLDISRFDDMERYDRLHSRLNAFGTGMYQNMNLAGLWPVLQKDYKQLPRDVARNMLPPFENVCKKVQLPPSPTSPRRTFANDEITRLWLACDDVMRILDAWRNNTGRLNEVTFEDYLNPGDDTKKIMGNMPEARAYGQMAFNAPQCGPGYEPVAYTGNPQVIGERAVRVAPYIMQDGRRVINPLARHTECAPTVNNLGELPATGNEMRVDEQVVVEPRQARQKRATHKKKRKTAPRRK